MITDTAGLIARLRDAAAGEEWGSYDDVDALRKDCEQAAALIEQQQRENAVRDEIIKRLSSRIPAAAVADMQRHGKAQVAEADAAAAANAKDAQSWRDSFAMLREGFWQVRIKTIHGGRLLQIDQICTDRAVYELCHAKALREMDSAIALAGQTEGEPK